MTCHKMTDHNNWWLASSYNTLGLRLKSQAKCDGIFLLMTGTFPVDIKPLKNHRCAIIITTDRILHKQAFP